MRQSDMELKANTGCLHKDGDEHVVTNQRHEKQKLGG